MEASKLKLNPGKMEALLVGGSHIQELCKQPVVGRWHQWQGIPMYSSCYIQLCLFLEQDSLSLSLHAVKVEFSA